MSVDDVIDDVVTVWAIMSLTVLAIESTVDPTLVVTAVAGLGGYRLRRGRRSVRSGR